MTSERKCSSSFHYLLLIALFAIAAIGIIAFTKPGTSATDVIGHLKQDIKLRNNDVARGMALDLWKFEYTLTPGNYYVDTWLEAWDKETSTTSRLSPGKSFDDTEIAGGNIVFSISDPATTPEEKNKLWRYVIDTQLTHANGPTSSAGKQMNIITNPLLNVGMTGCHDTNQVAIRLREEITLITWISGKMVRLSGDHESMRRNNDRSVMLKMKVAPAIEAFK